MKTPNSLEDLMRSWTPRKPSPQVEEELFGVKGEQPAFQPRRRVTHLPWWQTLGASAVAFSVAILTLLNVAHLTANHGGVGSLSLSLSNHSFAASFAMANAPINTLSAPILGWTNEGTSGSNTRSFDLLSTNRLLH